MTSCDVASQLADFKPTAKIDFITLRLSNGINTAAIRGRVDTPKSKHADWVTIHDPHRSDLQYLIDNHPAAEILTLEVAVDMFLKDGTNDPERLQAAHRHLAINLFPQAHHRLGEQARRKIYTDNGQIRPDTMKTGSGGKSVYWANANGFEQVRLYVKMLDNKRPVKGQHSTRLEITLNRGGCQNAGINRVCLLPGFAIIVRSYLSPFFKVAAGIKPDIARTRTKNPDKAVKAAHAAAKARQGAERAYERYGAAWAAKHGRKIVPDRQASAAIGDALKGLREQLSGLKLPNNSAELLKRWGPQSLMYQGVSEYHASLSMEASSILPVSEAPGGAYDQGGASDQDGPVGPQDQPDRTLNHLDIAKLGADIESDKDST